MKITKSDIQQQVSDDPVSVAMPSWHVFALGWIAAVPPVIKTAMMLPHSDYRLTPRQHDRAGRIEDQVNAAWDAAVLEMETLNNSTIYSPLWTGEGNPDELEMRAWSWVESLESAPAGLDVDATLHQAEKVIKAMWPKEKS